MKNETKTPARTAARSGTAKSPKSGGEDLQKIFEDQLKDIYWAEKHLTKALPKMSKAASTEELKQAFTNHLEETKGQVERLDKVFQLLGKKPQAKKCVAMEGLVKEGEEAIEEYEMGAGRDVALIVSAQKVEHYEIAAYGSLRAMADVMDEADCVSLFEETLEEEGNADKTLTSISENVNQSAYEVNEEMEDAK